MKRFFIASLLIVACLLLVGMYLWWSSKGKELMLTPLPHKDHAGRTQLELRGRGYDGHVLHLLDVRYKRLPDGSIDESRGESETTFPLGGLTISVNDVDYPEEATWHVPLEEWVTVSPDGLPSLVYTGKRGTDRWYEYYVQLK